MTLEDLVIELRAKDLLLNNLYQLDSGVWRASVRSAVKDLCFEFGDGASPTEAVRHSIQRMGAGTPAIKNRPRLMAAPKETGDDLLTRLGLK